MTTKPMTSRSLKEYIGADQVVTLAEQAEIMKAKKLETVFNRGLSSGLYMGRNFDEWASGEGNQSKTKRLFVGKVLHYFPKKGVALIEVLSKITLNEGDNCVITGKKTGLVRCKLKNMVIENKTIKRVVQKNKFTIKIKEKVRKNDDVFVINNTKN